MSDAERIDLLAGQIDALFTVTCTLISRSSEGTRLLEVLTSMTQGRQAMSEAQKDPHPVPEAFLVGYHNMCDRVLTFTKSSLSLP